MKIILLFSALFITYYRLLFEVYLHQQINLQCPYLTYFFIYITLSHILLIVYVVLFYVRTLDKANTLRLLITCLPLNTLIPFYLIPLFLIIALIANDEWLRRVFRWKLIVFSGIDGSGKSTHSKDTALYLIREFNVNVRCYHWFEHKLLTSLSILYAKIRGKKIILHKVMCGQEVYTNEFRRKLRTSSAIFRPLILLLDNWIFIGFTLLKNFIMGRWVICDRYFYDYFIRLKVLGYPIPKIIEWLAFNVVPRPHLFIVLDVNPILSYKRRSGEHPLWYYVLARKEFIKLAKKLNGILINTQKPYEYVQAYINVTIKKMTMLNADNKSFKRRQF